MALILFCVFFSVVGQILLKKGMMEVGRFEGRAILPYFASAFTNPSILSALLLYLISLGLWLIVLSRQRLGFAYLVFGLTYIFIPLASWKFFGERLTWAQIVGMVLIAAGVTIVGAGR